MTYQWRGAIVEWSQGSYGVGAVVHPPAGVVAVVLDLSQTYNGDQYLGW